MHKPNTLPRSATLSFLLLSSSRSPGKRIHCLYLRKSSVKCLSEDCLILSRLKTSKFKYGISELSGFNDSLIFCFVFLNPDYENNASMLHKLKRILSDCNYILRKDTSALYFLPHIYSSQTTQCKTNLHT